MNRRTIKYICIAVLLLFCAGAMPSTASAQNTEQQPRVIKVAYLLTPGYQEGGEGEYKTGQGYEYLQKIASYTGWTYEYVYGDFGELLQLLKDGEIDLMGNLSYTEERAQYISYGSYEQGREAFYVYVQGTASGISTDDFSTFNGKRIGVSADSYQEKLWIDWCEEHGIQCEIVEFRSLKESRDALNAGTVDVFLGNLILNKDEETKNWRNLFSFGEAPYYFCVNKDKPELLEELNKAQGKILNADPYYNEDLMKRYIANGGMSITEPDDDEKAWLRQHSQALKVGCLKGYLPISDVDEDGAAHGVLPDVLAAIKENYQEYDIKYEMVVYNDYRQMFEDLKAGKIDIAAPVYENYWNADREGISLTNPFMNTTMLLLQKRGYSIDNIKKIGIDKQSTIQIVYAQIYYPDCEQILYPSMQEVAKALKNDEIDAALSTACSYHVNAILYTDLGNLSRSTLPQNIGISMAVARQNPELMSMINRGLASIGDTVVYNSQAINSIVEKKVTITDYISSNPVMTIVIVGAIIVFAVLLITILSIMVVRLKNANERASIDAMTGLLNKVSMRELTKEELKRGGVMFMVDIDNFKMINDELGHEIGDKVINHLAESLQKIFRSGDLIGRFGGDEFLVFLPGTPIREDIIKSKVDQMQCALAECEVFTQNPGMAACSVSAGVLVLETGSNISYTEAFKRVDAALYEAKNKGKNTFVITKGK